MSVRTQQLLSFVLSLIAGPVWVGLPSDISAQSNVKKDSNVEARISNAREAFSNGDYDKAIDQLEPLLEPVPRIEDSHLKKEAHELFAVNLYFHSKHIQSKSRRKLLVKQARQHFLALLRMDGDYELDPLIYPESVLELFEEVRQNNRKQLTALKQVNENNLKGIRDSGEPIYIERKVDRHLYGLNFVPFGAGQFQNGDLLKGILFATGQTLSLGLNIGSYVAVERLRNANGRFDPGPNRQGGDFQRAKRWQRVQYGAIIAFGAIYIGSVVDGLYHYRSETLIEIKALDTAPKELDQLAPPPPQSSLSIGLTPFGIVGRW